MTEVATENGAELFRIAADGFSDEDVRKAAERMAVALGAHLSVAVVPSPRGGYAAVTASTDEGEP